MKNRAWILRSTQNDGYKKELQNDSSSPPPSEPMNPIFSSSPRDEMPMLIQDQAETDTLSHEASDTRLLSSDHHSRASSQVKSGHMNSLD